MLKGGDEIEKNNNKNLSGLRIKDSPNRQEEKKKKETRRREVNVKTINYEKN